MLIWNVIEQNTGGTLYRAKVPNGWLVKEVNNVYINMQDGSNPLTNDGYEWTSSITFVPDPDDEWFIE